jgi:hypothetical protein
MCAKAATPRTYVPIHCRVWHFASVIAARYFGSYWGISGHDADIAKPTRMISYFEHSARKQCSVHVRSNTYMSSSVSSSIWY